jgi:hypothetical protein
MFNLRYAAPARFTALVQFPAPEGVGGIRRIAAMMADELDNVMPLWERSLLLFSIVLPNPRHQQFYLRKEITSEGGSSSFIHF